MLFSELFSINRSQSDDFFDAMLSVDTPLFIDPFLLYAQEDGLFAGSHAEIIQFFNRAFQLIAQSGGNAESVLYKRAVNMLRFPEVDDLCLGYTRGGTRGSGSGMQIAVVIAAALWEAIEAGVEQITHFEETGILREGIGADRISDATAGILRRRMVQYTPSVCQRHGVPTESTRYRRGFYDPETQVWCPLESKLPRNPYNEKPVLLVPYRYLRSLPTVNADGFWDYCYANENEVLRNEYSHDITRNVSKARIIDFARRHPEVRRRYLQHLEGRAPDSYDLWLDPKGLVRWYDATGEYCRNSPLAFQIRCDDDFLSVVGRMVDEYRHFVVENQGWRLLWNDNHTPRSEKIAQFLLLGIVKHYCQANDIDVSREADIGRGPVDFKVSRGYALRALIEVKLAKNTRFWNGLRAQLPTYQAAERVRCAYFIVIFFSDSDARKTAKSQLIHRLCR
jgi:hypothetical protein